MMEQGQLLSAEVLPKVAKEMKKAAMAGGALEQKLNSTRVAQGRFMTALQLAQDKVFKSGFDKGLANLFQTMTDAMNDNGITLERTGKIYEKIFNGLASLFQVATKWVEMFVRSLESLWKVFEWGVQHPFESIITALFTLKGLMLAFPNLMGAVGTAIVTVLRGPLAIITAILGAIDEVRAVFDENVIGLGENDKASAEDRRIAAVNARVSAGFGSEADKKYLSTLSEDRVRQAQEQAGGAARYFGYNSANPFKGFGQNLGSGAYNLVQSSKDAFNTGFSQTIIVQGNMTEDNIQQIRVETQKVIEQVGMMNSFGMR